MEEEKLLLGDLSPKNRSDIKYKIRVTNQCKI